MTPEQMHFFALEIEKISGLKMPSFKPPKPVTLSGPAMSSTSKSMKPVKNMIQPLPKG